MKLYVDQSVPQTAYKSLNDAANEFNSHGKEFFRIIEYGTQHPKSTDGYNTVYWYNTWDVPIADEEGRTRMVYSGNELVDADILIDAEHFMFGYAPSMIMGNEVDLTSLFVHELGHSLGLAHTDADGSVMNPTLQTGQVRRTLGAIDLDDLSCEY